MQIFKEYLEKIPHQNSERIILETIFKRKFVSAQTYIQFQETDIRIMSIYTFHPTLPFKINS